VRVSHIPVLLGPALDYLAIRPDGIYVDATFGAGGHSSAILSRLTTGRLISFDADPAAIPRAQAMADPRFTFVSANFRELPDELDRRGVASIDGVLFDLGVSSMQFDDSERGFSLGKAAPLDMRMDTRMERSAYDVLATASETELADIFFHYGEERAARRIAHAIIGRRLAGALPETTTEFASLVSGILHRSGHRERIHPATRVFQALRIAVNDELDALRDGLDVAILRLRDAGRVVAISFNSLEDRIVKQKLRGDERVSVLTKKPLGPTETEIAENPRSRSAKLRAAQRKAS
jgi:16S rRNA (cytosine1402-N4)-methyltransferase